MRGVAKTKAVMGAALLAGAFLICGDLKAADVIKPGDKVKIDFTCRLGNGEIAATTDKKISADTNIRKSSVFQPRQDDEALVITAGQDEAVYGKTGERPFEGEIVAEMGTAVVGMTPGETKNLNIKRDPRNPQGNEPMFLDMARVRTRPKEMKMTADEYQSRTGKAPEVGQEYTMDPAVPGKVSSISGGEVVVRFKAVSGTRVKTPLGQGEIRDGEKQYEIVIDAKKGDLVRSGGMIGRIVQVTDRMITIDYSHPFGYEALKCEVRAQSIEQTD
jgi:FKBP-type peptidyl-prolyl cis-trans isomerase 2